MKKIHILTILVIVLLNIVATSTQEKRQKNKRYNPYKTKEKLEQEEEFDEPELLSTVKTEQSEEDLEELEISETKNKENVEVPEEEKEIISEKYEHSEELEIEASKHKLFLQLFTIYEVLMMFFVLVFLFVCFTGKSANDKLAAVWYANNKQYFVNNYAHLGTETQYNADSPIFKESYNNFKFYASGRVNVNSNLVSLDLIKRQDLVSYITSLFFPMEKDRLIYDISINSSDIPFVFCICRKKDIKFMKKTYPDIDFMTQAYDADFLNSTSTSSKSANKNLILLTEEDETIDKLFDRTLRNLYEQIEKNIDIIYFTDRQSYSKEKLSLFCSFYIDNMKNALTITKFVHCLVDKLAYMDFNNKRKANAEKLRIDYIEYLDKLNQKKLQNDDEEIDKKVQEAKKKSESQSKKLLTKEQMMKLEEKERKEKLKRQQKKFMKVMK